MSHSGTIILPPRYLGSVDYFALLCSASEAIIDTSLPFNKRAKATHRTDIYDANGLCRLTVPIVKPQSASTASWADIIISPHDAWWNIHFTALQSAYGRTPYFEFYEDDFRPLYTSAAAGRPLTEWTAELDRLVMRLIGANTTMRHDAPTPSMQAVNHCHQPIPQIITHPYYQLRSDRHPFIPGLSIVDLLFNYGPETISILQYKIR